MSHPSALIPPDNTTAMLPIESDSDSTIIQFYNTAGRYLWSCFVSQIEDQFNDGAAYRSSEAGAIDGCRLLFSNWEGGPPPREAISRDARGHYHVGPFVLVLKEVQA